MQDKLDRAFVIFPLSNFFCRIKNKQDMHSTPDNTVPEITTPLPKRPLPSLPREQSGEKHFKTDFDKGFGFDDNEFPQGHLPPEIETPKLAK